MPGLDFDRLRSDITILQVLELLNFQPASRSGDQLYGTCPLHEASDERSRCFSVNTRLNRYRCHKCGSFGNALDLWAAAKNTDVYHAALQLCELLHIEPPWIHRW